MRKEGEFYVDKIIDEVNNIKVGSPFRVSYADSPVDMYKSMKLKIDMDIKEVIEVENANDLDNEIIKKRKGLKKKKKKKF